MESLADEICRVRLARFWGRVVRIKAGLVHVSGLDMHASVGDRVALSMGCGGVVHGEIIALEPGDAVVLTEGPVEGLSVGADVELLFAPRIAPDESWIGRVVDPFAQPLDGRPLRDGPVSRGYRRPPPAAATRGRLGVRMATGMAVFDTLLPLVRGQRIGLFAGSGVGKSTLLSNLARGVEADVIVIAMIGERGRELREFVESVLGPEGMARSVVVAATSDQSPLVRRRCAWAAMSVAEYFRDLGKHVLFLADSITRFAEAHREIALAGGESASDRGYPPSTSHLIMSLAERAGPGPDLPDQPRGDITGIFSVLVAGSDMDEPVADILRGVLDGHVVMDRAIAERGRFPAIDVLRSVSRSLPHAASETENQMIRHARAALGAYAESETMIKAGLYAAGSDPALDEAVRIWPALDAFVGLPSGGGVSASFQALAAALRSAPQGRGQARAGAVRLS
ncbi:MAG: FliI/YscN family ATPase [Paracoccus sp. (in: a-proteobacteria)]|uniref:FliI/YscN family ATPase n=1 Tax=Paracoccus sp. TaxID=267 RepID=UPI0026E09F2E|nr:FliI/YscN family ATPase [Paracoccus sp. (in: a-proteobacteria)]MDO5621228.1 FliI/YscN family ATPase [Paracoccus sp. (in: a-proteobacteria)]